MADSPLPAKTAVKTFDDIGPEFNFTVKVSEAGQREISASFFVDLFHFKML